MATCLMCFESRPLKIVGKCKHSFCIECLSTVFESVDSTSEIFACPTCKADCPRPWDGVKGLVTEGKDVGTDVVATAKPKPTKEPKKDRIQRTLDVKCQICIRKKIEVQAVSLCVRCDHFYFCQECDDIHAGKTATKHHQVTYLVPTREKVLAVCTSHDADLASYCKTCGEAVCTVCVMLDHGDHEVEDIAVTIGAQATGVKVKLMLRENALSNMQDLKKELTILNTLVPIVDKQDRLNKDIEDHAEKCIKQIIKRKEDLKAQVKADFTIIKDIPEYLENVKLTVGDLSNAVNQAQKVLAETEEYSPVYLDKLATLQGSLDDVGVVRCGVGDGRELRKELAELHRQSNEFIPDTDSSRFGKIDRTVRPKTFNTSEVFKHTMQVTAKDVFIPCVANLGKAFAVAHPTREGVLSNAIDIYDLQGTLITTLTDHVAPVYDMSPTANGKLAVLTDGKSGTGKCVKIFDPEDGYACTSSTKDIDIARPLSLGVTPEDQYVILGDKIDGEQHITLTDEDGAVKYTHAMTIDVKRLKCGGRFIFVIGMHDIYIYEIQEAGIKRTRSMQVLKGDNTLADISASPWDDFHPTWLGGANLCWSPHQLTGSEGHHHLPTGISHSGLDKNVRTSTSDDHIVVSHGHTIRVFSIS